MNLKKPIWAVDCETDPFVFGRTPRPFIWGAKKLFENDYEEFDGPDATDDFLHWARQQDAIFYAHNGGKFDWQFIAGDIPAYQRLMIINGRYSKFKIDEAEFRDSWNILPIPLAAFRKTEFDYEKLEESVRHEHMAEIKSYLCDDCHDLGELIEAFILKHGVQLTQAGAAMKYWQNMTGRKADKTTSSYFEKFSNYYYGGRVECFEKGIIEDEFVVADINSAYPYAMQFQHVTGTQYVQDDELPDNDDEISQSFITIMAESTGAFPFRGDNNSLSFPNDGVIRKFNVTGWEYLAARDTETLKSAKIVECITFMQTIDFVDYVTDLYTKRKEAKRAKDKANDILYKLLLNSLYGKFGANPDNYAEFMTVPWEDVAAAYEVDGWELSGKTPSMAVMEKPLNDANKRYYNVATAASITGFVRAYLWRAICASDGVIYCDTDCVVARHIEGVKFDPNELGAWDIEARSSYGAIAGKKLYAIKTENGDFKTASKGVKLEPKDIIRVANGENVVYKNDAPTFRRKGKKPVTFVERTVKMT